MICKLITKGTWISKITMTNWKAWQVLNLATYDGGEVFCLVFKSHILHHKLVMTAEETFTSTSLFFFPLVEILNSILHAEDL